MSAGKRSFSSNSHSRPLSHDPHSDLQSQESSSTASGAEILTLPDSSSSVLGMPLSQYVAQMSLNDATNSSCPRPNTASLLDADCERPTTLPYPDDDLSTIEDDESPGWRDDEWETAEPCVKPTTASTDSGPDILVQSPNTTANNTRRQRSAMVNELDLRPATTMNAQSISPIGTAHHDMHATREVDLGSLAAGLFTPKDEQVSSARPSSRRMSRPSSSQRPKSAAKTGRRPMPLDTRALQAVHASYGGSQSGALPHRNIHSAAVSSAAQRESSAGEGEGGVRPPSRQRPPPEALHLFTPLKGNPAQGFAPDRSAPTSARPSTTMAMLSARSAASTASPALFVQQRHTTDHEYSRPLSGRLQAGRRPALP
ncbi:hypothetical protein WJX72_012175 [[Myrmecia] bisecta]|uniref:Uncharacterized protein n=1 Tax=[Myrmecia] bisecta TaxID=41462 RepID=A0AAW1PPX6_9CHLO